MDRMVHLALASAAASLSNERCEAVLAVLGWAGRPVTLIEAAERAGVSRETVRRDRDRIARELADLPEAAQVASRLVELLGATGGGDLGALSRRALQDGLLEEASGLAPVLTTLTAAGLLTPVIHSASGSSVELDLRGGSLRVARAHLANGLPYRACSEHEVASLGVLVARGEARWLHRGSDAWASLSANQASDSPGGRAVRRLVTMTGPLSWTDLLVAWGRAQGKAPHEPLPARIDILDAWVGDMPGLHLYDRGGLIGAIDPPVVLDRTSRFLVSALRQAPAGLSRAELLDAGERAGLRRSGLAAALSQHPALVSLQRGQWALRTSSRPTSAPVAEADVASVTARLAKRRRARPTTFEWSPDGELLLEFSVPSGPSPVVAVPRVIANVLAGVRLRLRTPDADLDGQMVVREARAWGFGPALTHLGLRPGDRAVLTCDLVAGAVTVTPVQLKEGMPR